MVSDLVLARGLPESVKGSLEAYAGCIGGAVPRSEYVRLMETAGFRDVRILEEKSFDFGPEAKWFANAFRIPQDVVREAAGSISSVSFLGKKPAVQRRA